MIKLHHISFIWCVQGITVKVRNDCLCIYIHGLRKIWGELSCQWQVKFSAFSYTSSCLLQAGLGMLLGHICEISSGINQYSPISYIQFAVMTPSPLLLILPTTFTHWLYNGRMHQVEDPPSARGIHYVEPDAWQLTCSMPDPGHSLLNPLTYKQIGK